ncbi:MAG: TIR domain-containing protein [Myxococcales bacterium]|nr:TIR domain-containing protein [Myxococcales bacterium]
MSQSIFLSYVYEDRKHRDNIRRWAKDGLLGANVVTTTEAGDLRPQGQAAIRDHLRPLIRGAAAVVCLVGQDTHNHQWVKYELDAATSLNKPIILARIPNTSGPAPEGHRHHTIHSLDPSTIRNLL